MTAFPRTRPTWPPRCSMRRVIPVARLACRLPPTCSHRDQFHQSRLAADAIPSSIPYQETMQQLMHYFAAQGSSIAQAQQQAIAWIGQQVQAQASLLAYMDVFWTLMLVSAAAVPLALLLRKVKLGGEVHLGH